jgi:glycosyltransferase involved in cell wall biosynthesis
MARVSVVIPATRPQFLSQAIASVLAQTFQDYELLVSDNSAAGDLRPLVAQFGDPRVRYIRAGGLRQGEHFALLWDTTTGPLLKYLFDDDFLLPFCLAILVGELEGRPEASFAWTQRHFVSPEGQILESPKALAPQGVRPLLPPDRLVGMILGRCDNLIGEPSNVLVNRVVCGGSECLTTYQGFRLRYLFDVGLYLNGLARAPCIGVAEFHAAFRQHPRQFSLPEVNPLFASGLYEWELFIRGELAAGRLAPADALSGLDKVAALYRWAQGRFPELQTFLTQLPEARRRIEYGDKDLLDAGFRHVWSEAQDVAELRLAQRASAQA